MTIYSVKCWLRRGWFRFGFWECGFRRDRRPSFPSRGNFAARLRRRTSLDTTRYSCCRRNSSPRRSKIWSAWIDCWESQAKCTCASRPSLRKYWCHRSSSRGLLSCTARSISSLLRSPRSSSLRFSSCKLTPSCVDCTLWCSTGPKSWNQCRTQHPSARLNRRAGSTRTANSNYWSL